MKKYYSQYEQDKFLAEKVFKNQKSGFFIDIDAMDGKRMSNSKYFADSGWKGILVEANPKEEEVLYKNRSNENWPIIMKAVVPNDNTLKNVKYLAFEVGKWGEALSGIVDNYHPAHTQRILQEHKQKHIKKIPEPIDVPTISVADLFADHKEVDILSLDTEGGELEILRSIDYDKCFIKTITVENNYKDPQFKAFLNSRNFILVKNLGCDEVYINKQLKGKLQLLLLLADRLRGRLLLLAGRLRGQLLLLAGRLRAQL